MAYVLGQYNKNKNSSSNSFMTIIPDDAATRMQESEDSGVTSI